VRMWRRSRNCGAFSGGMHCTATTEKHATAKDRRQGQESLSNAKGEAASPFSRRKQCNEQRKWHKHCAQHRQHKHNQQQESEMENHRYKAQCSIGLRRRVSKIY